MSKHILSTFEESLLSLERDIDEMGRLALASVDLAARCALSLEAEACSLAESQDVRIDELEKNIDRVGIQIITKFQPVASDLRTVIVAMKVGADLERVADLAVSISRRARRLSEGGTGVFSEKLERAFQLVREMIQEALAARNVEGAERAKLVIAKDAQLDALCREIDGDIAEAVAMAPAEASSLVQIAIISRNLERMGDHAKNMAEDAIFLATGHDIRHT